MNEMHREDKQYATWYEFKKDLEKRLGCMLSNQRWLEVKPEAPLPWDGAHMQAAHSAVVRFKTREDSLENGIGKGNLGLVPPV